MSSTPEANPPTQVSPAHEQPVNTVPQTPKKTASSLYRQALVASTPRAMSSGDLFSGHVKASNVEDSLRLELSLPGAQHDLHEEDLLNFLQPVATEQEINDFLSHSPVNSWDVPTEVNHERDLYGPLARLFNNILNFYQRYDDDGRKVLNNRSWLKHQEIYTEVAIQPSEKVETAPDVRIVGLGLHFKSDQPAETKNYERIISPIEVKKNKNRQGKDKILGQCANYARQCFIQQKGRRFVFVPNFTEDAARLLIFDRGGAVISPWINYRDNPEVLVRIVLLAAGGKTTVDAQPDTWERDIALGVNPSITWKGSAQTITVNGNDYKVCGDMFGSQAIRGRGTCVWRVVDSQNRRRIIKYLWRADGRTPEWEHLKKLKDIVGVASLVDYQVEPSLFTLRPVLTKNTYFGNDREASFMVLEEYGDNITKFKSPLRFLEAFRDAVAAHQKVWDRGILHRDISANNILYGPDNAPEGGRGVIIDMDMGIEFNRKACLVLADWLTGTLAFQSCHVLGSHAGCSQNGMLIWHDYLDDLESFLWVFVWITTGFQVLEDGSSSPAAPPPPIWTHFQSEPCVAEGIKFKHISCPESVFLHDSWPPQFDVLKTELMTFFKHYNAIKWKGRKKFPTFEGLVVPSQYHYKRFLGYVDQAIADLKSGECRDVDNLVFDFTADDRAIAEDQAECEADLLMEHALLGEPVSDSEDEVFSAVITNWEAAYRPVNPPSATPPRTPRGRLLDLESPTTPSQVDNTVGRGEKRMLDEDDNCTKRFKTPTGSIGSPFASPKA
ncbi:hypothetical protein CVT24_009604 [Panaeolus cyanescens]|uniref:Fungal-type protein kinase domain-containing protein n=1 Tax=Panaeolus cyanescens TaxID=181874 RepID=A0A409YA30_9AGAR|nr:hypothetical protein CVT24_009604 [Panaeolus cyanescens]